MWVFPQVSNNVAQSSLLTLGSGSKLQLPVSHAVTTNTLKPFGTHATIWFSLLAQYSIHLINNCKIGFVLHDFAQLEANVKCSEHIQGRPSYDTQSVGV